MNLPEIPQPQRDAFYQAVWRIARMIPPGKVSTYGQIASFIPTPAGISQEDYEAYRARWVGNAMAACPQDVPWQRVINAQGKISTRQSASLQRRLLEQEGILFDTKDRVNLKQFGWPGPS